jgi:hypothetical protein
MPGIGPFRRESENHSLKGRLSGGGCSLPLTRLWDKIPVNREKYREFPVVERARSRLSLINTGVNGFQPEIVTGNEQGKNRRDNRENMSQNRKSVFVPLYMVRII